MPRRSIGLVFAAVLLFSTGAQAADSIGKIKTLDGEAIVVRGGENIPAVLGMDVQQGDRVETKAKSAIGILFADDT